MTTDVVFTWSLETLDDAVVREWCRPPDQTLLALARCPDVGRLYAADPWRWVGASVLRRRSLRAVDRTSLAGRPLTRLRPLRARRGDPLDLPGLQAAYRAYGRRLGMALARDLGTGAQAVLVSYHPFVAAWSSDQPWVQRVVYVGRDDWAASPRLPAYRDGFLAAYTRMADNGVVRFAVSGWLAERLGPSPHPVGVVPNGVDDARYARPASPPARWAGRPRPVAVYAGTIDARLDVGLVRRTAARCGTVLLIGPVADPAVGQAVADLPGVHLTGRLGQAELAAVLRDADVGLLPHVTNDWTSAMSPLKLYEYLAAGLPVAAVDLPPVRDVHPWVETGPADRWEGTLGRALARGRMGEPQRATTAASFSWGARQQVVVDAALGRRGSQTRAAAGPA